MDEKQIWYGHYYSLGEVYRFLHGQDPHAYQRAKTHELFITWVVGQFLQSQRQKEFLIGFPSLKQGHKLMLTELFASRTIADGENFDTVIVDSANPQEPMRVQVKRYTRAPNATTEDLSDFICSKVGRYGKAPELSVVIHIQQEMRLDLPLLAKSIRREDIKVGSILVFGETTSKQRCFLFELYPNYKGELRYPEGPEA